MGEAGQEQIPEPDRTKMLLVKTHSPQ